MRCRHWSLGLVVWAAVSSAGHGTLSPLPRPAVCFAPGTDPAYVKKIYANLAGGQSALPPPPLFQFVDGARWATTATSGGGLTQGSPTILTWSVVPDGLTIPIAGSIPGEVAGPSTLRARLNALYGNESVWRPLIQQAFDEWGTRTGTTYVFHNDDGAVFLTSPGTNGGIGRGDIRIAGRAIDGDSNILAYNYFPQVGDMVIDAPDAFYSNTTSGSLRLRNVVSHEHGHGLGFDHVCPTSQTKLMEPIFSANFVGPQHDDILAGQRGYGDDRENNDTAATGTNFGAVGNGTLTANGGSIDDNADVDFYRFTVPAGKSLAVTVTPVGATYLEGPQDPNTGFCSAGTSFNSLIANDVGVDVRASNGTTVLATANSQPAGGVETLSGVVLGPAGEYYVRVFGGGNDTVQLYNVSITISDGQIADLSITKSDGQTTAIPGQTVTYTIVATNNSGTITVNSATVADTFPAILTGVSWSCAASGGSSCGGGGGTGNISRAVNLAPGGSVTFSATGTIASTATGTLVNSATVTPPAAVGDPTTANNLATDTDTLTPQADFSIIKTNGQTTSVPGTAVGYTITVTNNGPSVGNGALVTDTFPAAIAAGAWTCAASAGSVCGAPSGSGNIGIMVSLLPGGSAVFNTTGTISPTATGSLVNTATVGGPIVGTDPSSGNNSATDSDTLAPTADLAITKTDGQTTAVPGTPVSYTIVASNAGPSASGAATVSDTFPSLSGVTWTCVSSAGSTCPASGSGNLAASVSLAPGGSATFSATGTINPAATGTLANTAIATVPGGVSDPVPGNNSATDTDTLTPQADFSISKTDGQLVATPGSALSYTIAVTNNGPSAPAATATVADTLPAALTGVTWTCSATAGSSCPAGGSGNLSVPVILLPGGTATFVVNATVSLSATGTVSNTASVTAPVSVTDPVTGNNTSTDTDNLTLDVTELGHGSVLSRDLRPAGALPAEHFYWLSQKPFSSYEAVVDGTSGDIGPILDLARMAGDATTVLQSSVGVSGIGFSRSLRFVNDSPASQDGELIRVRSGSCTTACGPDDVYRIRLRETTGRIARFNNSATQITVVVLQNTTTDTINGTIYFWRATGAPVASQPFTLAPRSLVVVNSSLLAGLAGASGSITIAHDGAYGTLTGKSVALEPATGFSFDSPLVLPLQ
jgi:uncharacterized repeat protein (TIGR01451 family)